MVDSAERPASTQQPDGVTFLAYFLLAPGQEPELTMHPA